MRAGHWVGTSIWSLSPSCQHSQTISTGDSYCTDALCMLESTRRSSDLSSTSLPMPSSSDMPSSSARELSFSSSAVSKVTWRASSLTDSLSGPNRAMTACWG